MIRQVWPVLIPRLRSKEFFLTGPLPVYTQIRGNLIKLANEEKKNKK